MATYEYRCEDCKATFRVSQAISEHDKRHHAPTCPKCHGRRTEQVFSTFFAKTASKS